MDYRLKLSPKEYQDYLALCVQGKGDYVAGLLLGKLHLHIPIKEVEKNDKPKRGKK